jgi:hypothetical protein
MARPCSRSDSQLSARRTSLPDRVFARRRVRSRFYRHQVVLCPSGARWLERRQTCDEETDERTRMGMVEGHRAAEIAGGA